MAKKEKLKKEHTTQGNHEKNDSQKSKQQSKQNKNDESALENQSSIGRYMNK